MEYANEVSAKVGSLTRAETQTEMMLSEVLGQIRKLELSLEIVLSDEMPMPETPVNVQNRVQAKLHEAISRLNSLNSRINL